MTSFTFPLQRSELLPHVQYLVSLSVVFAAKSIAPGVRAMRVCAGGVACEGVWRVRAACAACVAQVDVRIKWPNDIYIGEKTKIGGRRRALVHVHVCMCTHMCVCACVSMCERACLQAAFFARAPCREP